MSKKKKFQTIDVYDRYGEDVAILQITKRGVRVNLNAGYSGRDISYKEL